MANMQQIQRLPSTNTPHHPRFTVGRDRGGRWIVQDRKGLVGGLFVNEAAALHFAAEACNRDAAEICRTNMALTLEFASSASKSDNIH